jgi:hypothetical protein
LNILSAVDTVLSLGVGKGGVLLCLKRGVLTKTCAKSESEVTGMERYDEEEAKAKEEYEKHKCKNCVYAKWQGIYIVSCLFPRCVKERLEK